MRVPQSEGKPLGCLGDFLTGHFFPQGPVGLKGDKGPPGPVGANVSISALAVERAGEGCIFRAEVSSSEAAVIGLGWELAHWVKSLSHKLEDLSLEP